MNITELGKKYKLDNKNDIWKLERKNSKTGYVTKIWIIKHDAVEKIAEIEGIIFEEPKVYCEMNCLCLLGFAKMGKKRIWSTGEAGDKNVGMSGYYFAMAEKRLKDRLTLKLINAYEYGIYSDIEAEDFKKNNTAENFIGKGKNDKKVQQVKRELDYRAKIERPIKNDLNFK